MKGAEGAEVAVEAEVVEEEVVVEGEEEAEEPFAEEVERLGMVEHSGCLSVAVEAVEVAVVAVAVAAVAAPPSELAVACRLVETAGR